MDNEYPSDACISSQFYCLWAHSKLLGDFRFAPGLENGFTGSMHLGRRVIREDSSLEMFINLLKLGMLIKFTRFLSIIAFSERYCFS